VLGRACDARCRRDCRVFQDGHMYLDPEGEVRAGVVFDNLIHRGEMPITIGVFVDPGEPGNRNAEYDAFTDAYAIFLLTEILPSVQKRHRIADDPDQWAICGGSSGGNCALTVAWMRPERFRRVLTFVAAFPQVRGGNRYPELIRDTPMKPLRVFMQAATRDLYWNEPEYNFFSANLRRRGARGTRLRTPPGSRRRRPQPVSRGRGPSRRAPLGSGARRTRLRARSRSRSRARPRRCPGWR
jgi:hypothetical protein